MTSPVTHAEASSVELSPSSSVDVAPEFIAPTREQSEEQFTPSSSETAERESGVGEPHGGCIEPLSPNPFVEIEDPHGVLRKFYQELDAIESGERDEVLRIGHWSDSTLASDDMSSFIRRRLQTRFGDGGHGYVMPQDDIPHYVHRDVRTRSGGRWQNVPLVGSKTSDGRYGLGGWASIGLKGAWAMVGTSGAGSEVGQHASRFFLYYRKSPRGAPLKVERDGVVIAEVDTFSEDEVDAHLVLDFPDGPQRIVTRVEGNPGARLYGMALERKGPAIIYDSFGILGVKARRFERINRVHWAESLKARPHALFIIQIGGNDLQAWHRVKTSTYKRQFKQVIDLFQQARPEAACLIMSPHDHGSRTHGGVIKSYRGQAGIVAAQREVALDAGCAWFSMFEATGGLDSVAQMFRDKEIAADLRHLRRRGAKRLGHLFVDALERGLERWRRARPCKREIPVSASPSVSEESG